MPKKWLNGSGKLDGLTNIFLEAFGPDFTAKVSKIMGSFPAVPKGKKNGTWQKGGLIKGKPKLAKRGC